MEIRLDQYRIFLAVSREKSFSAAAKLLFITQSAVSQAIRQLEEALQAQLFIRGGKGVTLTRQGQLLSEYIETAMERISAGEVRLRQMQSLSGGELKIGAADTITAHVLLPLLEKFHQQYPEVKLQIINRTSDDVALLLKSGGIDLGFVNLPFGDTELEITPFMQVHDIFVGGTAFQEDAKNYTREELAQLPLILLEKKANSRRVVEKEFLRGGVTLKPEIELGGHSLLLQLAKINLGVACVVQEFSREALQSGQVFQLNEAQPLPVRAMGYCFFKKLSPSPAAKRFVEVLLTAQAT